MATPAPRRSLPLVYERENVAEYSERFPDLRVFPSTYRTHGKRLLDVLLAIPLCLVALPITGLLALLVVLTSGRPAFYGAARVGRNGETFRMWKLRTMVQEADKMPDRWRETDPEKALLYFQNYKLKTDPRVTRLGRFMRKTSLDELPQFWNVLRGDMSLVGPRPIVAGELENYGRAITAFLSVRPGITGVWQTGGRSSIDYPERAQVELAYVLRIGLAEDVKLLLLTVPSVLFCRGAH